MQMEDYPFATPPISNTATLPNHVAITFAGRKQNIQETIFWTWGSAKETLVVTHIRALFNYSHVSINNKKSGIIS